jgi:hypothetical protein
MKLHWFSKSGLEDIVRPIAIGECHVRIYFQDEKSLGAGLGRAIKDVKSRNWKTRRS